MTAQEVLELDFSRPLARRTVWVLLSLLLLWSFGLRLWYATPDLNPTRFWDERYGLENLEPLLKEGQLRPVHGFHPGFSYLPHGLLLKTSDIAYRLTGWERLAIFDSRGRYTPTTYMICRTVSVLFGTASLWLVFLIGRRLGDDRLGLLAALFLSVVPWHLRQSILFKADITLLFTVVLTFYLSQRAVERPTLRRFIATGVAIGLALSSKFNAGPVAIPVTLGAFASRIPKRRAWWLLVVAAAVSVGVFLLLQPFAILDPDIYRRSMGTTSRVYERVAAREGGHSRLYLFWHLLETLMSASFHGPWIGALALIGFASLTILSVRRLRQSRVALGWCMALAYVLSYTALYALATPRPSPHNWLPISPFAALAAAWALLAAWLLLSRLVASPLWRPAGAAFMVLLALSLTAQASAYTYRETVPSTSDRALELLRARVGRPAGRLVLTEHDLGSLFQTRHRRGRLAILTVDDLRRQTAVELAGSDVEIFPAHRLESPASRSFYLQRMGRVAPEDVVVIGPRLLHTWGPALVTVLHPWKSTGQVGGMMERTADDPLLFTASLPPATESVAHRSVVFTTPRRTRPLTVLLDERPIDYVMYRGPRRQTPRTTFRFLDGSEIAVRMKRAAGPDSFPITVRQWRQKRPGEQRPTTDD